MLTHTWNKFSIFLIAIIATYQLPTVVYAEDSYSSQFINQSNEGPIKYVLVKTRVWPESGCVVDSGQEILMPGDKTQLVISKKPGCEEAGIGYSFYKNEDTKRENLLGYVSHRFRDGKFSLQISMFCEGGQCVFRNLDPDQTIKK
ncbi:Uncharacterised protein [Legionella busanensis]|uniref:Uncharacterized protein n=1 Tax=Legionella busanensis TaxID=190655 RepID=A0A378JN42_9GAMM|nr:hypothetical protein [Legionella busanensis]STX52497.1 Uncharacterised protein [Legionella busanensis]